jgi:putative acetyltransferase
VDFKIRPIRIEDAEAISEIRRQDGVRENIMGIISERVTRMQNLINGLTESDHMLVAEVEENGIVKVVGSANLSVNKSNIIRHSGGIGISV